MAKRAKAPAKRRSTSAKSLKVAPGELRTLLDFVRYAASRFIASPDAALVLDAEGAARLAASVGDLL